MHCYTALGYPVIHPIAIRVALLQRPFPFRMNAFFSSVKLTGQAKSILFKYGQDEYWYCY